MTQQEWRQQVEQYYAMIQQGVPRREAFQQAFPNGIPTQQDMERQAAKDQQSQVIPQVGGALVGALGTKAGVDYISQSGWFDPKTGIAAKWGEPAATAATSATAAHAGSLGSSAPAAPTIVAANRGTSDAANSAATGTNWGAIAQGGAAALQGYQAYRDYQQGNYLGAGVNAAAAGTNAAALGGSELAASATPYLGPIAGAYGAYQTAKMTGQMPSGGRRNSNAAISGAAAGASAGSAFGPIGTGVGAVVGGLAGLAGSYFGSSKGSDQMIRDSGRKYLKQQGILDDKYQGTLADGTVWDFGKDGKKFGKPDLDNPLYDQAAMYADALGAAEGLVGGSRRSMNQMYTRAALSNAGGDPEKLRQNFEHFAKQRGFTLDAIKSQYDEMLAKNDISQSQYNAWMNESAKFVPAGAAAPVAQANRTQTASPGISKEGKAIKYDPSKLKKALSSGNFQKLQPGMPPPQQQPPMQIPMGQPGAGLMNSLNNAKMQGSAVYGSPFMQPKQANPRAYMTPSQR